MSAPVLYTEPNGLAFTLDTPYVAASGVLALPAGSGATVVARLAAEELPSVSATTPLAAVLVPAANVNQYGLVTSWTGCLVLKATGLTTDTLTVAAAHSGTDVGFADGATVLFGPTAEAAAAVKAGVLANYAAITALAALSITVTDALPPAASSMYRGVTCTVRSAGVRDEFFRCVLEADGVTYQWEQF